MRRAIGMLATTAVLTGGSLLAGGPAYAGSGQVFRFSTSGSTADAFFSTYPADGVAVPGVVYEDVYVVGADSATKADGTAYADRFAFVDVFRYRFDRRGNFEFLGETYGFASGDAVSFSMDRRLSAAALDARLEVYSCSGREECVAAGTGTVSLRWTGYGDVVRSVGNYRYGSRQFNQTGHQRGSSRSATASGTVLGQDRSGAVYASLFEGSFSDRWVCHGSC